VSLFEARYTYTGLSRTRRKYQIPTCTLYTTAPYLLSPNIANSMVLRNTRSHVWKEGTRRNTIVGQATFLNQVFPLDDKGNLDINHARLVNHPYIYIDIYGEASTHVFLDIYGKTSLCVFLVLRHQAKATATPMF
jgi:hypothetical protein